MSISRREKLRLALNYLENAKTMLDTAGDIMVGEGIFGTDDSVFLDESVVPNILEWQERVDKELAE